MDLWARVGKHNYELPLLVSAVLVDLVTGHVQLNDGFKIPTSSPFKLQPPPPYRRFDI